MRFRIAAPLALLPLVTLMFPARPLRAQDSTARPGPWLVGAGLTLMSGHTAGPAVQLGREWRASDSRFGLRLSGEYTGINPGPAPVYGYSTSERLGVSEMNEHALSLSLLTTFALTKGRIQPYLLSGFMLQHRSGTARFTYDDASLLAPGTPTTQEQPFTRFQAALGMEAGAGIQVRVKGHWLFSEVRTEIPGLGSGYGAPRMNTRPYTFGFRF